METAVGADAGCAPSDALTPFVKTEMRHLYPELAERCVVAGSHRDQSVERRNASPLGCDSDTSFDAFLETLRTPRDKPKSEQLRRLSSFIVSDSEEESAESPSAHRRLLLSERRRPRLDDLNCAFSLHDVSDDSDDEAVGGVAERTSVSPDDVGHLVFNPPGRARVRRGRMKTYSSAESEPSTAPPPPLVRAQSEASLHCGDGAFLRALDMGATPQTAAPAAAYLGSRFSRSRQALSAQLFGLFNARVFDDEASGAWPAGRGERGAVQLPTDLPIKWNARLRKTAGQCVFRRGAAVQRTARIELSEKVCDAADRVRDTLIHEMCHAAAWIISADSSGGHGTTWKHWAMKARKVFPQLPMIARCHVYHIKHKYKYRCVRCGQQVHRHSKSLDVDRKACGVCSGAFELVAEGAAATPRAPPKFALFVKDNYGSVKKALNTNAHKDVMAALGEQFRAAKLSE